MMTDLVKIIARPKLNTPNMLAAWPGISNVAMIVATYLARKLEVKDLAEIRPANFFDPIGVLVRDNLIEDPQFPQSRFYYWKNKNGGNDIILFIGEAQPAAKGYDLANCVLDAAVRFKARRIFTCAAALTRIHHTEQPRVWGVGTNQNLARELAGLNLLKGGNLQISGLNGLLLGVAKEREMDGVCLLGEVPSYASRLQNPMAALAIINVLKEMLSIDINTEELMHFANEAREQMKQVAAEAMEEYIDYFTEPIWQHDEEEGDEELD
ncbi:MAG: PAC2 family protein [Dehalococcoidales bacterium]|nr:PAC2 family protein [Dehalococcoidales bacterium]